MSGDMEAILNYFGWVALSAVAGFAVGVLYRNWRR